MKIAIKLSTYARVLVPVLLLSIWLVVGVFGGPAFGKLSQIVTNDQSTFLPASAEATKVQKLQTKFIGSKAVPAIVVLEARRRLLPSDLRQFVLLRQKLAGVQGVSPGQNSVIGPIPSADGKAVEFIVQLHDGTDKLKTAVAELRADVAGGLPAGTTGYVTGPAGLLADLFSAFSGIDSILLYVALAAVFIILVIVYRSVVLPFLVIMASTLALCGAGLVIHYTVTAGWLNLNSQSQGILSILAIGAATDYSLLLIARYHEALERHDSKWDAMLHALRASIEPISASAATVIAGVLCLLFSQLNANKYLGPIAATGILFSYLSAMTLLPVVLLIFGRAAFWPFRPKLLADGARHRIGADAGHERRRGLWGKIPPLIARHPRAMWLTCLVILAAAAVAVPQFKADGVAQSAAILGKSDAVTGQKALARHFPAGSGSPAVIIADAAKVLPVVNVVTHTLGVSTAVPYTGQLPLPGLSARQAAKPVIVDGKVLINATMSVSADSRAGQQVVQDLRSRLRAVDRSALVGGTSAISYDTNQAATADLHRIIPIVLLVILLILMLLLRSLLAPAILIASVILSFTATIGASALIFNHIFHFPGSDAAIPLFGFIFLVALGVDYNIFLMTRVREESLQFGTRPGILRGLGVTGSVITSAGIVLASTFASLSVIPVLFLAQIAFIVTSGVLVDTFIVRTLLVPALCYDIGKRIWWPSKLWRTRQK
jgi:RND superfamily putative drug exporter